MALHMADNGFYGIKIHPKKSGDEIVVENLKAVLTQYGDVKLFQHPNKYLAFAYYEHHEEARTCLNNMRISQDYAVSPGWPKQTTADEKSKTSFKPSIKEDTKDVTDIIDTKINNENETTDTIAKSLMKKQMEDDNENSTDKKTSPEDQKKKMISKGKIKFGTNNDRLNSNIENKPEQNENNKNEPKENDQNDKKENKFTKQLKQIINEVNALNLEKANLQAKERKERKSNRKNKSAPKIRLSRSECRKDTNSNVNSENQTAQRYSKRNRHYSASRANNHYSRKGAKNNCNFKTDLQKEIFQNEKDISTNKQKKTKETAQAQHDLSKPATEPIECCLVPAIDVWIAENIKYHKSTKLASYVVILNLPVVINAGIIYDLCKSFVSVLHIDIKYPDIIYLPPHAFVYTKTKDDANLLKNILNGKRLKTKLLLVKTEEELENS